MNKLISKSPIQQFKQGKKIEKFKNSAKITLIDKENDIWKNLSTGELYRRNWRGRHWKRTPEGGDFNDYFEKYTPTKSSNSSPSRFEANARYLGLKINTNSNGNRFYTQNGQNFFENGDVYNINDGKNKVRVVKDFAEQYHPTNNKNYNLSSKDNKSNLATSSKSSTTSNSKSGSPASSKSSLTTPSKTSVGTRTRVLPNRAVNGYTLPEEVNDVAEVQRQLIKEKYLLPKYGVDGLWGTETQAAWEAKKSFDKLQNMKENFGNNHPTPTTISPELQQAFTRTTPDYIGEPISTNEPLAFQLPQNVNRKYVRSMIGTFGRNPYGDYTPQERIQMRNEINNGTFDANKQFGELGQNNIQPIQSDQQTTTTSSTNTPPSSQYNMGGFNRFLTNWLNQNPGIYNNLASIFAVHQPSVATPTYVPNYNENNPLTYRYATSIYKQGGLISKNPVKQFKTNFRKGAL